MPEANIRYDYVSAYTMKARLYLNKEQQGIVERILTGVRLFYNCTMYAMLNDMECTKEVKSKTEPDKIIHYPDFKAARNATWIGKLREEHEIISEVPAGALSGNNGCIGADLTKSLGKKRSIEYINQQIAFAKSVKKSQILSKEEKKAKLVNVQVPHYYNKNHPRLSYTYQETGSKISATDNPKVIKVSLNKLGVCKIRGWNENIRFSKDGTVNFVEYCKTNKTKQITVTVSKDLCGDYYICFTLLDVYVPIKDIHGEAVGIDVGLKNIATLSDGTMYEHKRFKKEEKRNIKLINRKLARRQGWANEKFREARKTDKDLQVSQGYLKVQKEHEELERKITRRREHYNHFVTHDIVERHDALAVESLDVKGMQKNKYLAYDLADAAIGDVLNKLKYKSQWHNTEIRAVEKDYPSSQICSACGYQNETLTLSKRKWKCPNCGTVHDRDVNAAKNLLNHAYNL